MHEHKCYLQHTYKEARHSLDYSIALFCFLEVPVNEEERNFRKGGVGQDPVVFVCYVSSSIEFAQHQSYFSRLYKMILLNPLTYN